MLFFVVIVGCELWVWFYRAIFVVFCVVLGFTSIFENCSKSIFPDKFRSGFSHISNVCFPLLLPVNYPYSFLSAETFFFLRLGYFFYGTRQSLFRGDFTAFFLENSPAFLCALCCTYSSWLSSTFLLDFVDFFCTLVRCSLSKNTMFLSSFNACMHFSRVKVDFFLRSNFSYANFLMLWNSSECDENETFCSQNKNISETNQLAFCGRVFSPLEVGFRSAKSRFSPGCFIWNLKTKQSGDNNEIWLTLVLFGSLHSFRPGLVTRQARGCPEGLSKNFETKIFAKAKTNEPLIGLW